MKTIAYKDITLHQMRSFCATARQGSLTAAATLLEMAQPTVWKQVHTLEKMFGAKLIEPHARGCRLTEAGKVLYRLLEPTVANLDLERLRARFDEALGRINVHFTVAGQPRVLSEDLPPCLASYLPRWPRTCFTLRQAYGDEIAELVESSEVSLGFTTYIDNHRQYPDLSFDPWYELEVILLTPRNHPLARRQRVRLEDLKPYPLINTTTALGDTGVHAMLVKLGMYETEPRAIQARQTAVIYRCVELGLGIALVPGLWPREMHPQVHERVMRRDFGPISVHLVQRRGVYLPDALRAFAEEVRVQLGTQRKKRGPSGS